MGAAVVGPGSGWNTWAELILGAAVLRHGQHSWDAVASELRTRTRFPTLFTPQACKTKYEELQKRYSAGSRVWFEELRKQCVEELKQELARSEASIGFLESQIKYLEAEKHNPDYCWSQTGSPLDALNPDGSEPSSQNTSKDEHSAGSYTKRHDQEMEIDTKPGLSVSSDHDEDLGIQKLAEAGQEVIAGKRRSQRKRKDCNQAVTEGSVGESDNLGSSNAGSTSWSEATAPNHNQNRNSAMKNHNHNASAYTVKTLNLMAIFQCITQSEPALVFKHRMDSQKRARYRKIMRQHVDIGMIRSKIISRSIKSVKELLRDLLLLASNALVFYSRETREHRSALSLRHLIMKEYKQHCMGSCREAAPPVLLLNPPVRLRSARPRPCKDKLPEKCSNAANIIPANDSNASEGLCNSGGYGVSLNALFEATDWKG